MADPPGFGTDALRSINLLGGVTAPELDDGPVLPETEVICEYMENVFPKRFDAPKPPEGNPKVAAYWAAIGKDPHIA